MKTPDVMREFREKFCVKVEDGEYPTYKGPPLQMEQFIQEKLNERGEMIAKAIERCRTHGIITEERPDYNMALEDAAMLARSYKE